MTADVLHDVHHDWRHLYHAVSVLSHDRILSVAREVLGRADPVVGRIADVASDALAAACRATSTQRRLGEGAPALGGALAGRTSAR